MRSSLIMTSSVSPLTIPVAWMILLTCFCDWRKSLLLTQRHQYQVLEEGPLSPPSWISLSCKELIPIFPNFTFHSLCNHCSKFGITICLVPYLRNSKDSLSLRKQSKARLVRDSRFGQHEQLSFRGSSLFYISGFYCLIGSCQNLTNIFL